MQAEHIRLIPRIPCCSYSGLSKSTIWFDIVDYHPESRFSSGLCKVFSLQYACICLKLFGYHSKCILWRFINWTHNFSICERAILIGATISIFRKSEETAESTRNSSHSLSQMLFPRHPSLAKVQNRCCRRRRWTTMFRSRPCRWLCNDSRRPARHTATSLRQLRWSNLRLLCGKMCWRHQIGVIEVCLCVCTCDSWLGTISSQWLRFFSCLGGSSFSDR